MIIDKDFNISTTTTKTYSTHNNRQHPFPLHPSYWCTHTSTHTCNQQTIVSNTENDFPFSVLNYIPFLLLCVCNDNSPHIALRQHNRSSPICTTTKPRHILPHILLPFTSLTIHPPLNPINPFTHSYPYNKIYFKIQKRTIVCDAPRYRSMPSRSNVSEFS